jgi:hypothetical protein
MSADATDKPAVILKQPRRRRLYAKPYPGSKHMDAGDCYHTILTDGDADMSPLDVTVALVALSVPLVSDAEMPDSEPLDAEMPDASPTGPRPTR